MTEQGTPEMDKPREGESWGTGDQGQGGGMSTDDQGQGGGMGTGTE
jgi:hypothetical protein